MELTNAELDMIAVALDHLGDYYKDASEYEDAASEVAYWRGLAQTAANLRERVLDDLVSRESEA